MRAAVIVFPGSNCDRDMVEALRQSGADVAKVWHKDAELPQGLDHAHRGGYVLGVCNGFQVLSETGLVPGALMRNSGLKFLCKTVGLTVETQDSAFTADYSQGSEIQVPIAHHDGNFYATEEELKALEGEDRVAFRYSDNPNGSISSIAGVLSANRRVLGMMPHPERAMDAQMGSADGQALFRALVGQTTHG